MDEQEAISRLRQGGINGLETLVHKYQLQGLKAATLVTGDYPLAEDVVQEAFLRVYKRAHQFDPSRPFGPWFLKIVVNDAVKAARKRNRLASLDHGANEPAFSLAELVPDPQPTPEEWAEQTEAQQTVWEAIKRLPPAQRAVIVRRYYLELTDAEIAEQSGQAKGTVKQLLHRARRRLGLLLDSNA